jgi:hypothetical protein
MNNQDLLAAFDDPRFTRCERIGLDVVPQDPRPARGFPSSDLLAEATLAMGTGLASCYMAPPAP